MKNYRNVGYCKLRLTDIFPLDRLNLSSNESSFSISVLVGPKGMLWVSKFGGAAELTELWNNIASRIIWSIYLNI